jgi:hypothetical protein
MRELMIEREAPSHKRIPNHPNNSFNHFTNSKKEHRAFVLN